MPPATPRSCAAREAASAAVSTSRATRSGFMTNGSDDVGEAVDAVARGVVMQSVQDLRPDERVDEVGRPHLDRVGAGDHELQRVAGVANAANADDGNLNHLPAL